MACNIFALRTYFLNLYLDCYIDVIICVAISVVYITYVSNKLFFIAFTSFNLKQLYWLGLGTSFAGIT